MFDLTIEREKTDGEYVTETYEGVVDFKRPPHSSFAMLEFKDGSREKVTLGHIVGGTSPLK